MTFVLVFAILMRGEFLPLQGVGPIYFETAEACLHVAGIFNVGREGKPDKAHCWPVGQRP